MSLDDVIDLSITIKDAAVSRAGFGTPLILTGGILAKDATPYQGAVRSYASLGAIADDGFATDGDAYCAAQALLSQSPRPSKIKIGCCTNAVSSLEEAATEIEAIDSDWYALIPGPASPAADALLPLAAWTEARRKLLLATSDEPKTMGSDVDDVASQLRNLGYHRTALIYHPAPESYPAAAWGGVMLPKAPGSASWKFKTLSGVAAVSLTDTQRGHVDAKHCNHYTRMAGVSIMREGYASSGRYLDVTRGIDWLHARMQEALFSTLANTEKIPYTDGGIGIIENIIRGVLGRGVAAGLLDESSIVVSVPRVRDVSATERINRVLPDVSFGVRLTGSIHRIKINGTVSV